MELTDTNRPRACHYLLCFASTVQLPRYGRDKIRTARGTCSLGQCNSYLYRVSVIMAKGKHPAPFRTRKLSLSAPMVLHGGPCGRLGRRRTNNTSGSVIRERA